MFGGTEWEVVSVGKGAGGAGTTEIDLMKTADGYSPVVGSKLDRTKVLAALEIKSSLSAAKGMSFGLGDQGHRLLKVFSSDKLAISVPDRTWSPSRGWGVNKVAAAGIALTAWGIYNQVHAISNIDSYSEQFNEVLTTASSYRQSVNSGASNHERYQNFASFIMASHNYMSNFMDTASMAIVTESSLRAGIFREYKNE
jgi:hypothetical protein